MGNWNHKKQNCGYGRDYCSLLNSSQKTSEAGSQKWSINRLCHFHGPCVRKASPLISSPNSILHSRPRKMRPVLPWTTNWTVWSFSYLSSNMFIHRLWHWPFPMSYVIGFYASHVHITYLSQSWRSNNSRYFFLSFICSSKFHKLLSLSSHNSAIKHAWRRVAFAEAEDHVAQVATQRLQALCSSLSSSQQHAMCKISAQLTKSSKFFKWFRNEKSNLLTETK